MKAEKGDLIRIVDAEAGERYRNGEIYEVIDRATFIGVSIRIDGERNYVRDSEYVIHRKAGEEECRSAREFLAELQAEQDAVNHPNHYTQGKFETIEVIEEITRGYDDGYVAYCVGNALKYEARAPFKHDTPLEDLRKAAKYLAFAIDYLDAKST